MFHQVLHWSGSNISRISDPDAEKPEDWDEDAPQKIPDPEAEKPDDWLEDGPEFIPDPEAAMPEDWCVIDIQYTHCIHPSILNITPSLWGI